MIVDIVDKYRTDDNNPIKNLRLIIWSIVIIINSVLTLQVSTANPMIADRVE